MIERREGKIQLLVLDIPGSSSKPFHSEHDSHDSCDGEQYTTRVSHQVGGSTVLVISGLKGTRVGDAVAAGYGGAGSNRFVFVGAGSRGRVGTLGLRAGDGFGGVEGGGQ